MTRIEKSKTLGKTDFQNEEKNAITRFTLINILDKIESSHAIADGREQSVSIGCEGYGASFVDYTAQISKLETILGQYGEIWILIPRIEGDGRQRIQKNASIHDLLVLAAQSRTLKLSFILADTTIPHE